MGGTASSTSVVVNARLASEIDENEDENEDLQLASEIEQLQESQERMEGRLEGRRALLERQFLIMEQTMAQMEAQQSSFASQLGGLAGQ